MTEAQQPDGEPGPEQEQHEHVHEPHEHYGVLPPDGVEDLTDKLTGFMNEIELGGLSDIIGQVLDDFLEQCGGMPADLMARDAFEQIAGNQLAVTLAYQLGRLEGRSSQLVDNLVARAVETFWFSPGGRVRGDHRRGPEEPQGAGVPASAPHGVRPAPDSADSGTG